MEIVRHRQTIERDAHRALRLPVSTTTKLRQNSRKVVVSPYFQPEVSLHRKVGTGRDINLSLYYMNSIYANNFTLNQSSSDSQVIISYDIISPSQGTASASTTVPLPTTGQEINAAIKADLISFAFLNWSQTIAPGYVQMMNPGSDLIARSFATPSRTINSAFQISTTRDALAFYSVSIPTNLSLSGGENGAVVLEYADDSGISTNVVTVGTVRNGNTGTLTIGLNTLASMGCQISGVVPAGKYVRLRPVDTTGSPVQAFVSAQEVLI